MRIVGPKDSIKRALESLEQYYVALKLDMEPEAALQIIRDYKKKNKLNSKYLEIEYDKLTLQQIIYEGIQICIKRGKKEIVGNFFHELTIYDTELILISYIKRPSIHGVGCILMLLEKLLTLKNRYVYGYVKRLQKIQFFSRRKALENLLSKVIQPSGNLEDLTYLRLKNRLAINVIKNMILKEKDNKETPSLVIYLRFEELEHLATSSKYLAHLDQHLNLFVKILEELVSIRSMHAQSLGKGLLAVLQKEAHWMQQEFDDEVFMEKLTGTSKPDPSDHSHSPLHIEMVSSEDESSKSLGIRRLEGLPQESSGWRAYYEDDEKMKYPNSWPKRGSALLSDKETLPTRENVELLQRKVEDLLKEMDIFK